MLSRVKFWESSQSIINGSVFFFFALFLSHNFFFFFAVDPKQILDFIVEFLN